MTSPTDKYAGATPGPYELRRSRQDGMFCIRMGTFYACGQIGLANATLLADAWTLAAENAELRAALDEAAASLELTAAWVAEEGHKGTATGIANDAAKARAALSRKEPGQ